MPPFFLMPPDAALAIIILVKAYEPKRPPAGPRLKNR